MAEELHIRQNATREEIYTELYPQLEALVYGETDLIANLSNIMAALKSSLGFFWVGVYFVKEEQLVLGPFQGSVACTRIDMGKGVCGFAWQEKKSVIVPDVDAFPGHIACSSLSRSEIVVPVFDSSGKMWMLIDVDSDSLNDFGEVDRFHLEKIAGLISRLKG